MAVDARLLMTDAAPIAQGLQSVGQGISGMMGQKRQMDINKLAGRALMGDQGAMEGLMTQAPDVAMGVQRRQEQQSEAERQRQIQRQKQLQSELADLAPGIASARDLNEANVRIKSELATGAWPAATALAGEDGMLDEQEWQMFKDIAAQQMGGTRVGKTDVLPDGTTIVATSRGPRVYAATGELLTGERASTAIQQAQEFGAEIQGLRSGLRREGALRSEIDLGAEAEKEKEAGKLTAKKIEGISEKLPGIRSSIKDYDRAIDLIRQGAQTGVIAQKVPSIRSATKQLEALQREFGLDVINSATFGALSESELKVAMQTGLPTELDGPELIQYLERKRDAQEKLANYMEDAAVFLSQPGNTTGDWVALQKRRREQAEQQGGEIKLDADTQSLLDKYGA